MNEEKNEIDRIREAYEYRLQVNEDNLKIKILELDQMKLKYNGVMPRENILNEKEAIIGARDRYLLLDKLQQVAKEETEEYYRGAIAAYENVLTYKAPKEVLLQKR